MEYLTAILQGGDREASEDYRQAGHTDRNIKKNGKALGNKVEAIGLLKESGYTVKEACLALGISRSSYYSAKIVTSPASEVREIERAEGFQSDGALVEKIKEIKGCHPFWGYRQLSMVKA